MHRRIPTEVKNKWRKLHNDRLHNLYPSHSKPFVREGLIMRWKLKRTGNEENEKTIPYTLWTENVMERTLDRRMEGQY
jgi:hypothetical protein